MRKLLIPFDKKSINGRIYTKEVVHKCIGDDIRLWGVLEGSNNGPEINLKYVAAAGDIIIEEDGLYLDNYITLRTAAGKQSLQMKDCGCDLYIAPRGIGNINDDGIIHNFKLTGFEICTENPFPDTTYNPISSELVEVKPLPYTPTGTLFYLDFVYQDVDEFKNVIY